MKNSVKTFVEILKEAWEEKKKYFENVGFYANEIKKIAREVLGEDVRVLLFGSIVKGNWGPNSDIDVLIISEKLPEDLEGRGRIKTEIKRKINAFSPFQFHLVWPKEFEDWYKRFIKEGYLEI